MYFMGIDIGSLSCDVALIDDNMNIIATSVIPTGARNIEAIENAKKLALSEAGVMESDISATVSTGYGRRRVNTRLESVTEITCHARGMNSLLEGTRVLIDIGGQDSKAIFLGENGQVLDFAMNDKCAAGTGRFLEAMARALQVDIEQLSKLDYGAKKNLTISSMCTVFAESEVVSLVAEGIEVNEIVSGLNRSIATRTSSLIKRICPDLKDFSIAMSGGVANNSGVVRALSKALERDIIIPPKPDTVGALGAAIIAGEHWLAKK